MLGRLAVGVYRLWGTLTLYALLLMFCSAEQARDAALQKELESVRSINSVIEGVVSSLEAAKGNMDVRELIQLSIE